MTNMENKEEDWNPMEMWEKEKCDILDNIYNKNINNDTMKKHNSKNKTIIKQYPAKYADVIYKLMSNKQMFNDNYIISEIYFDNDKIEVKYTKYDSKLDIQDEYTLKEITELFEKTGIKTVDVRAKDGSFQYTYIDK